MDAKGDPKTPTGGQRVPRNAQNVPQCDPSDLQDHPKGDKPYFKIWKRQLRLKMLKNVSPRSPECKQPLAAVWAGGVTPWRKQLTNRIWVTLSEAVNGY